MKKVYISKNIKFLRNQKNVSQRKMAQDIGIGRSSLIKWENEVSIPDVYDIARLMEYFNVEDKDIIYNDLEEQYNENQKLLSLKTFLIENELADKDDNITMKDYCYITSFIYSTYKEMREQEKKET